MAVFINRGELESFGIGLNAKHNLSAVYLNGHVFVLSFSPCLHPGAMMFPSQSSHFDAMRRQALNEQIPVISPKNAAFLTQLLTQRRPQRMLEIGSAIGVSSAVIAQAIAPWGGHLTTIEISVPTQQAAAFNLERLGVRNVTSLCGDARNFLSVWAQLGDLPFDAVFIDAQKSQTHVFYSAALSMLSAGGTVIVDDVWRYREKMPLFYELLAHKMQAYSLHFVDGVDATMVLQPNERR
jgi:predicted O-methyltransferase YrrM